MLLMKAGLCIYLLFINRVTHSKRITSRFGNIGRVLNDLESMRNRGGIEKKIFYYG